MGVRVGVRVGVLVIVGVWVGVVVAVGALAVSVVDADAWSALVAKAVTVLVNDVAVVELAVAFTVMVAV